MILLLLIVLAAFAAFYAILQADLPGALKFVLVCAEMLLVGRYFIKKYKLSSELGLILLKSRKGLELIGQMATHVKAFNFMADMGGTVSYGLLSLVMLRRNVSLATVIPGLIALALISLLVAPGAFVFLLDVIGVSGGQGSASALTDKVSMGPAIVMAVLLTGGFFLLLVVGTILYGGVVLSALLKFVISGSDAIAKTSAGGTFLLPGINLPFFEGIIALIVVLVVHEGAHAVLARMAGVPIRSSGIVLFGVIPIGAFVEPDEKRLARVERVKRTRVLVAGPAANLLTSLAFFIVFIAFVMAVNAFGPVGGFAGQALKFVYTTLGLVFALNFVVGAVNILPIPLFDGYGILDVNVKNKLVVKAIGYTTLAFFALNFVPLLFH